MERMQAALTSSGRRSHGRVLPLLLSCLSASTCRVDARNFTDLRHQCITPSFTPPMQCVHSNNSTLCVLMHLQAPLSSCVSQAIFHLCGSRSSTFTFSTCGSNVNTPDATSISSFTCIELLRERNCSAPIHNPLFFIPLTALPSQLSLVLPLRRVGICN